MPDIAALQQWAQAQAADRNPRCATIDWLFMARDACVKPNKRYPVVSPKLD